MILKHNPTRHSRESGNPLEQLSEYDKIQMMAKKYSIKAGKNMTQKRKIDPTVDCVFKAIFGATENKNVCIHFLNSVLELQENARISKIEIQNPYNEREFKQDKLSVVDVKVEDQNKNRYQIEIQLKVYPDLPSRMLYTWTSIYHSNLEQGKDYSELKRVISIWVLKESLFSDIQDSYLDFCLYNRKHGIILTDHISIHLLQLSKYKHANKELSNKEKWTYLLKEGKEMNLNQLPQEIDIPEIRQAAQVMRRFSERESDYLLYESRLDAQREIATWERSWKRSIEHERQAKEEAIIAKEQAAIALQQAGIALEEERQARDQERIEKERLISILRQKGITDYN